MSDKNKIKFAHMPVADMNKIHNKKYEECVLCRENTLIPTDLTIGLRKNYIIGCGQLCPKCGEMIKRRTKKNLKDNIQNK